MPDRRAIYDTVVTVGVRAGGVGIFTPMFITPSRVMDDPYFPWLAGTPYTKVGYMTSPTAMYIAGSFLPAGPQTFLCNMQNAHRLRFLSRPGVTYIVIAVVQCLTRFGMPYSRVYFALDPVQP